MNSSGSIPREILIVENNLPDTGLIAGALREAVPGVTLTLATTVNEAYDFLFCTGNYTTRNAKQVPELILFSRHLLDTRGDELLQLLKSYAGMRTIPVRIFGSVQEFISILEERKVLRRNALSYPAQSDNPAPPPLSKLARAAQSSKS